MKKGISIWSFPTGMGICECFEMAKAAGFDGIEPALDESGPLSLSSTDDEIAGYRRAAVK